MVGPAQGAGLGDRIFQVSHWWCCAMASICLRIWSICFCQSPSGGVPAPVRRPSLARRPSPGSDPSKATSPQAVWMLRQRTIVVLPLSGHFSANPGWQVDGFMFMLQLNFSDDQAAVLARKHIDFPR